MGVQLNGSALDGDPPTYAESAFHCSILYQRRSRLGPLGIAYAEQTLLVDTMYLRLEGTDGTKATGLLGDNLVVP